MAFGLALALVIARGTMQEFLREPFDMQPGADAAPSAPGPAASIGLDLLCCVPAMLVLARRLIDKTRALRSPRGFIPLALLSGWMLLSACWAADKLGTLVTACHWAAAVAMLWAMVQLVRDWVKLRLVAAIVFGLLPIYVIQGLNYKFIELPDLIKNFSENKEKYLKEHGFQEDSFAAKQFADKIKLGEMFGYESSPNTFGAVLSLLIVVGGGVVIQRVAERENSGGQTARGTSLDPGVVAVGIAIGMGLWIMAYTRSRTAFATPVIAIVLLLGVWRFRGAMGRRSKAFYVAGVLSFALVAAAVIGHGIAHGSLVHSSLTFRWHYWVGSVGIFREHPWLGVGWNNFGLHYLAHRLPMAPEEVKDPHNFLMRFFIELGLIGGLLVVAWQLRLWWELTRPIVPSVDAERNQKNPGVIGFVAMVSGGGVLLSTLISVDFSMGAVELEVMRRLLFVGAMIVVSSLAALRTLHSQEADERPAPWILYPILVGIGVFLIHNLIDFSLFEIGPMMVFAVLVGSALGVRQGNVAPSPASSKGVGIAFAVAMVLWLAAALLLWGPVLAAERSAAAADEAIRTNRIPLATPFLEEANREAWHLNADYAYRAAAFAPASRWNDLIDEAIRENPREEKYYRFRANGRMAGLNPDATKVRADYEMAAALDPNNVQLHREYAAVLEKLGDAGGARKQYAEALRYNGLLNWDEKKRLRWEEVEEIEKRIRELR